MEDKSVTPCRGNTILCSSPGPLAPPQILKGLFELTRRPSRALVSPHALLLYLIIDPCQVLTYRHLRPLFDNQMVGSKRGPLKDGLSCDILGFMEPVSSTFEKK